MDSYAIMVRRKIKTDHELDSAYKHNDRIYNVENADAELSDRNQVIIDTYGQTYSDLFYKTLSEMKSIGVPSRTLRSDAIRGFEVMLTFSRERTQDLDVDAWIKANVEWLDKTFNPPEHKITFTDKETGEIKTAEVQNLKHIIYHGDEETPHIHAFVVPIDEKGNLNAHFYDRGRKHLRELQTDYAKKMEPFGLERGEEHSVASQEQRSRYYLHLTRAVDARLPEPEKGERVEDYRVRCEEVYQRALSNHRNEIVKKDQSIIHIRSSKDKRVIELLKENTEEKKLFSALLDALGEDKDKDKGIERERELVKDVKEIRAIKEAIEEHPDRDLAEELRRRMDEMLIWHAEREKQKEKEKAEKERKDRTESKHGSGGKKGSSGGKKKDRGDVER